jgi:hypothetical protein
MQVQLDVHAEFVSDVLREHDRTEMRIALIGTLRRRHLVRSY